MVQHSLPCVAYNRLGLSLGYVVPRTYFLEGKTINPSRFCYLAVAGYKQIFFDKPRYLTTR